MNYDHNLTLGGAMAVQSVRLTLGLWNYRKRMDVEVGGNCRGLAVIEAAIGSAYAKLETLPGEDDVAVIYLVDPYSMERLEVADEELQGEEWFKDLVIGAEILAIQPDLSWQGL